MDLTRVGPMKTKVVRPKGGIGENLTLKSLVSSHKTPLSSSCILAILLYQSFLSKS